MFASGNNPQGDLYQSLTVPRFEGRADQGIRHRAHPIADITIDYSDGDGTSAGYRLLCLGDTLKRSPATPDGIDVATVCLLLAVDDACALREHEVAIRSRTGIYGPPETVTVGLTFGPGRRGR